MDVAAVAAQGGVMPAVSGGGAMETGGISFGDVMAQMAGSGGEQGVMAQSAAASGMSWRDIQAVMNSSSVGVQTAALAGQSGLTTEEMLDSLIRMILENGSTDAASMFSANGGGGVQDLLELVMKMQQAAQDETGEDGEVDMNSQLLAMLTQLAAMQGANSEQTLFDLMVSQNSDEGMQQMIEALPKEALQALMTTPAYDNRTAAADLLADAQAQHAESTVAQNVQAAGTQAAVTPDAASTQGQQTLMEGMQPVLQQAAAAAAGTAASAAETAAQAAKALQAETVTLETQQAATQDEAGFTAQNQAATAAPTAQQAARPEAAQDFADALVETKTEAAPAPQAAAEAVKTEAAEPKSADAAGTKESKPTLEDLQQQVDSGMHLRNTAFAANVNAQNRVQQAVPVYTQVETQVRQAVKVGADEFTMKLTPEGLGDITVQLSKVADGSISLNIVTKGAEAQQLLSEQLNQLKTALGEMNVRVEPVMTEQQAALLAQQQQMNQSGARQQNTELQGAAYHRDEPLGEQAVEEAAPVQVSVQDDQLLDTYI